MIGLFRLFVFCATVAEKQHSCASGQRSGASLRPRRHHDLPDYGAHMRVRFACKQTLLWADSPRYDSSLVPWSGLFICATCSASSCVAGQHLSGCGGASAGTCTSCPAGNYSISSGKCGPDYSRQQFGSFGTDDSMIFTCEHLACNLLVLVLLRFTLMCMQSCAGAIALVGTSESMCEI